MGDEIETLYEAVRRQFPFFDSSHNPIFFENAGGSQVPGCVINGIKDYMSNNYVQLGGGYELSKKAGENVAMARELVTNMLNANGVGEVVMGSSSTQLLANLALTYSQKLGPGDEIIVQVGGHEANTGPWVRIAASTGATLKWWNCNVDDFTSSQEELRTLLTPASKLLAVTHVSNVLGGLLDVAGVVALARAQSPACRVVADGVAYAPHLSMDVAAWGVDWYVFSIYKTWGPHMAALYGSKEAFADLTEKCEGPGHFFVPKDAIPSKFEPGGVNHEGCAGLVQLSQYFRFLASLNQASAPAENDSSANGDTAKASTSKSIVADRNTIMRAYRTMIRLEAPLMEKIMMYLSSKPNVTIIGPAVGEAEVRVAIISFIHSTVSSKTISTALHAKGIAVKNGHMCALRLVTALGTRYPSLGSGEGVVRLSLCHYNTPREVELVIDALETVL